LLPSASRLRWLLSGFTDLVLPPRCGACGTYAGSSLCARCRARLEPDLESRSPVPHLDACLAAVAYAGDVPTWMQRFKYPRRGLAGLDPAPIGIFSDLIAETSRAVPGAPPELVIPVPLHPRRLRARGFNPAGLLARRVARECGVRFAPVALRRVRDTPSQTGLTRGARQRNVAGAFDLRGTAAGCVWLVDDVVTTGATLSECARVLRRAGARHIVGLCAARTPRSHEASDDESEISFEERTVLSGRAE
jgi:ComF family protein